MISISGWSWLAQENLTETPEETMAIDVTAIVVLLVCGILLLIGVNMKRKNPKSFVIMAFVAAAVCLWAWQFLERELLAWFAFGFALVGFVSLKSTRKALSEGWG